MELDSLRALADQQQVLIGETRLAPITSSSSRRLIAMMPLSAASRSPSAGLLHQPRLGGEHQVRGDLVVAQREHLGDPLVGLKREQVGHMLTTGIAAGVGQFVGLGPVDPPLLVKNKIQWWVVVTKKWSTMSSVRSWAPRTPLPPALRAVQVGLGALGVAAVGDRDRDVLFAIRSSSPPRRRRRRSRSAARLRTW